MAIEFSHEANQSPATAERRAEILANPGFGDYFTDHMVTIDWEGDYKTGGTWYDARVRPYGPLVLDPAASVFHYGQEILPLRGSAPMAPKRIASCCLRDSMVDSGRVSPVSSQC